MSKCSDHTVIQIGLNPPDELIGFFIKNGNHPTVRDLYDTVIFEAGPFSPEDAQLRMEGAKALVENAGFECGEVKTQSKVAWLELLFERPLTADEIEEINHPAEVDGEE